MQMYLFTLFAPFKVASPSTNMWTLNRVCEKFISGLGSIQKMIRKFMLLYYIFMFTPSIIDDSLAIWAAPGMKTLKDMFIQGLSSFQ